MLWRIDEGATLTNLYTTGHVPLNEWHHVVVGRNSTHSYLYIDGVLNGTTADNTPADLTDVADLGIAGSGYGGWPGGNSLGGRIDEVMIFNKSLSYTEIQDIYNNQSARFLPTGKQILDDQTYLNITDNRINVTATLLNNFGSSINLSINYITGV